MPAYLIAHVNVTDPEQYKEYTKLSPAAITKFGGKFIVRGGETLTLEGPQEKRRIVVIEFPDWEAAQAFWDSEDYQQAKAKRVDAAEGSFVLAKGI